MSFSGAANPMDGETSQRENGTPAMRRTTEPSQFVLPRSISQGSVHGSRSGGRVGGGDETVAALNGGTYFETSEGAHTLTLYQQLSLDLGDLLNRTDISDCFLNVKGEKRKKIDVQFIEIIVVFLSTCRNFYGRT